MNKSLRTLNTTLLNIGHVHLDQKWNYNNVISPFSRLYLIKSGHGTVHHNGRLFDLKPDYLYLIPSFSYSHYKCKKALEQVYIHFLEEVGSGLSVYNIKGFGYQVKATALIKKLCKRLLQLNPNRTLVEEDPRIYDNPASLRSFNERNNSQPSSANIETNGILQVLIAQFLEENWPTPHHINHKTAKIVDAIYFISEHLTETITVKALAMHCHMNIDYFSRLFKEQTGLRPIAYVQQKRIERAKVLLTTTDYSMQTIAGMVGLSNLSYFNRLFVKLSNATPGAYKREFWRV